MQARCSLRLLALLPKPPAGWVPPQLSTAAAMAAQPEIAFVPPGMVSPFYSGVISGAKPAAQKLGCKFVIIAPERESDFAGQAKIVEDMVENKVSGIALCAINIEAISSSVKKATSPRTFWSHTPTSTCSTA